MEGLIFGLGPVIILLIALTIPLAVATIIGFFVYKDAEKRGQNPLLWALVAALVPNFIGLIIYLVVRSSEGGRPCPSCTKVLKEEYAVCPYCSYALSGSCPNCQRRVEKDWHTCLHCAQDLPKP